MANIHNFSRTSYEKRSIFGKVPKNQTTIEEKVLSEEGQRHCVGGCPSLKLRILVEPPLGSLLLRQNVPFNKTEPIIETERNQKAR